MLRPSIVPPRRGRPRDAHPPAVAHPEIRPCFFSDTGGLEAPPLECHRRPLEAAPQRIGAADERLLDADVRCTLGHREGVLAGLKAGQYPLPVTEGAPHVRIEEALVGGADALWRRFERTTVAFEWGRLKSAGVTEETGANLRVRHRGRVGVAGTTAAGGNDGGAQHAAALLDRALASAELGEALDLEFPGPLSP